MVCVPYSLYPHLEAVLFVTIHVKAYTSAKRNSPHLLIKHSCSLSRCNIIQVFLNNSRYINVISLFRLADLVYVCALCSGASCVHIRSASAVPDNILSTCGQRELHRRDAYRKQVHLLLTAGAKSELFTARNKWHRQSDE